MDLFESNEPRSYFKSEQNSEVSARRLPWARFSSWLECVCVVTFDLELGQAIELVYPHEVKLTEKEKTSICYLSFPDSYSGCLGDTQFSFRVRQSVGRKTLWFQEENAYNREAPVALKRDTAHYYGYVYFRQVKDVSVKRGYFQKSLVLISRLPYVNLFQSLLQLIAPEYFEKLEPCLEAVCNEIDQWPAPIPGQTLNLPVMGVVIQMRIPSKNDKPGASPLKQSCQEKKKKLVICFSKAPVSSPGNHPMGMFHQPSLVLRRVPQVVDANNLTIPWNLLPAPMILSTVHELDLFKCFQPILIHIQMLWELMLLGEPIVIMAPSPTVSSETILALTSSISPLKYCCDYRPYFTIHDSEFKEYTTRTQAPPNVILGVTNPFFIKTFQYWPHIIRIGELKISGDLPKQVKVKKLTKLKTLDTKPGIYTAYKTFLHKDKTLIKRLLKGIQRKRPSEVQSAILRRHLLELTQSFIIPLERYLVSLMPLQRAVTPWKNPPQIRPFSQEEFMRTLEHSGPQLTSVLKGDWIGLYRLGKVFCFPQEEYFDLLAWIKDKSEVEIVDLVLKLREKLVKAHHQQLPVREEVLQKLELYIETIISSLPEDLQVVLHRH
ncbi:DEN6B protein, partial [Polyodon spathula]|nr:DEN6B protein [Polyodon spathula]